MSTIDEIEARANAATPGPWAWRGDVDAHSIYLQSRAPGQLTVMDFVRFGMNGAQPRFRGDHIVMGKASELPIFEVCPGCATRQDPRVYRGDIIGIRHPDAEFIARAREDVPTLIARIRELEAQLPDALADDGRAA